MGAVRGPVGTVVSGLLGARALGLARSLFLLALCIPARCVFLTLSSQSVRMESTLLFVVSLVSLILSSRVLILVVFIFSASNDPNRARRRPPDRHEK